MNTKRIVAAAITAAPVLLYAGSALAVATGITAIDTPINSTVRTIGYVGYGVGAVCAGGVVYHVKAGWTEMANHLAKGFVASACAVAYPTYAALYGGSAATLIHPIAHAAMKALG